MQSYGIVRSNRESVAGSDGARTCRPVAPSAGDRRNTSRVTITVLSMSDRDRSSPSLTDTPLKTYIGRHDDDYPLINGNGKSFDCPRATDLGHTSRGIALARPDTFDEGFRYSVRFNKLIYFKTIDTRLKFYKSTGLVDSMVQVEFSLDGGNSTVLLVFIVSSSFRVFSSLFFSYCSLEG